MNIIEKFLQAEINSKELYDDILYFINSYNIRNGEFEGNEYIIKKMDNDNFILFPEYVMENGQKEIPFSIAVYKKILLESINEYASKKGINLK